MDKIKILVGVVIIIGLIIVLIKALDYSSNNSTQEREHPAKTKPSKPRVKPAPKVVRPKVDTVQQVEPVDTLPRRTTRRTTRKSVRRSSNRTTRSRGTKKPSIKTPEKPVPTMPVLSECAIQTLANSAKRFAAANPGIDSATVQYSITSLLTPELAVYLDSLCTVETERIPLRISYGRRIKFENGAIKFVPYKAK